MTKEFIGLLKDLGEARAEVLDRYGKLVVGEVGFRFDGVNLS